MESDEAYPAILLSRVVADLEIAGIAELGVFDTPYRVSCCNHFDVLPPVVLASMLPYVPHQIDSCLMPREDLVGSCAVCGKRCAGKKQQASKTA